MQNDRLAWVDCAKGIGITLVVYTHVQRGVLAAELAPNSDIFAWVDYALFLTHMPLFFFLSGLFVGRSIEKGSKHFLLAKIQTVVYPYFLWSFVQGTIQITMAGSTNNVVHWGDLFVIAWKPFMQFWFLYALFLAQLAALVLYRHKPLIIALALLAYACRSVAPGILGDACYQFPFFVIGMLLADRGALDWPVGVERRERWVTALLAVAFVAFTIGSGRISGLDSIAWISLPATLVAVALVLWIARALNGAVATALQELGRASMTIYVLHTICGSATRIALLKLGVSSVPVLHLVAGTAVGLLGPLFVHHLLDRANLLPWVGLAMFKRSPRRHPPVASLSAGV